LRQNDDYAILTLSFIVAEWVTGLFASFSGGHDRLGGRARRRWRRSGTRGQATRQPPSFFPSRDRIGVCVGLEPTTTVRDWLTGSPGDQGGRDYGVWRTNGVGLPTWYYSTKFTGNPWALPSPPGRSQIITMINIVDQTSVWVKSPMFHYL